VPTRDVLAAVSVILDKLRRRKALYYAFMQAAHANPVASPWASDGKRMVRWSYDGRIVAVVGRMPMPGIRWRVHFRSTDKHGWASSVDEAMEEADRCLIDNGWVLS
jgi:hypothetical protein